VAGPWSERLAHFRLEFTPSAGEELQSEYLLPRCNALKAIKFLRSMAGTLDPVLLVSEIRTMKADGQWLSSAYATQTDHASSSSGNSSCKKAEQAAGFVGLHFTWKALPREVCAVLPALESALLPLGARPHWGKIFLADHVQLRGLYPRWNDFRALALKHDPHGLFRNQWTGEKLDLPPPLSVLTSRRNAATSPSATSLLSARL
jgi:xylitol oxidase